MSALIETNRRYLRKAELSVDDLPPPPLLVSDAKLVLRVLRQESSVICEVWLPKKN